MRTGILLSLLAVSLVGNAILLLRQPTASVAVRPSPPAPPQPAATLSSRSSPASAGAWSYLASDDLPSLVKRLREAGLTEKEIRALVSAEVEHRIKQRSRELLQKHASSNGSPRLPSESQVSWKTRMQLNELSRELRSTVDSLLGPVIPDSDAELPREQLAVAPEKRQALKAILDDYYALRQSLGEGHGSGGLMTASEKARLELLDSELKNDLAALCSPEELANLEMLRTETNSSMLYNAGDMNLPAETMRKLVQIDATLMKDSQRESTFDSFEARNNERDKQLREVLGEAQFAELQYRSSDEHRQLSKIAQRIGLSESVAREVYALKASSSQESVRIAEDTSRSMEDRTAALKALGASTRAQITAKLGVELAATYEKYGFYLRDLERGNAFRFTMNSSTSFSPRATPAKAPNP